MMLLGKLQFCGIFLLSLHFGNRFKPVLGGYGWFVLNNIQAQPYHHIEITYDYILFWFLSLDLAYSFDIFWFHYFVNTT